MPELKVKVSADTRGFSQGLESTKSEVAAWGKSLQREAQRAAAGMAASIKSAFAGAFSGAGLAAGIQGAIGGLFDRVTEIRNHAKTFNLTTDEVQKADKALHKYGLTFDDFGRVLEHTGNARKDAAEGNLKLREAFEALGVSLADLQNPANRDADIFFKIGETVRGTTNPAIRQFFKEIGGKSAVEIIPALDRIHEQFKGMVDKATLQSLAEAKAAIKALQDQITKGIAPVAGSAALSVSDDQPWYVKLAAAVGTLTNLPALAPLAKGLWGNNHLQAPLPGDNAFIGPMQGAPDLFADGVKERERVALLKSEKDLRDSMDKLGFEKLDEAGKKLYLQAKMNSLLEEANFLELQGLDQWSNDTRREAVEAEMQLLGMKEHHQALGGESKGLKSDQLVALGNFLGTDPGVGFGKPDAAAETAKAVLVLGVVRDLLADIRTNTRENRIDWPA